LWRAILRIIGAVTWHVVISRLAGRRRLGHERRWRSGGMVAL
jgi:hypothetical protein